MIRIDFDPSKIPGSLEFSVDDLRDPAGLAARLKNSPDSVSQYLRGVFSLATQQQLDSYDGLSPVTNALRDALIGELNNQLKDPDLFDKTRFRGIGLTLRTGRLIKQKLEGDYLICLNRLLLNEAYIYELAMSQKAEWQGWVLVAREATCKVIKDWDDWKPAWDAWNSHKQGDPPIFEPEWDDDVWKGFRDWFLENVFYNKCAYCETKIEGFIGDAEHFRPKGRVRVKLEDDTSEIVKTVDENKVQIQHPGYFWLAYHWQNLLPSCQLCNRYSGKKDLFPVEKSHVAVKRLTVAEIADLIEKITQSSRAADIFYLEPRDLDVFEGRLLLHPYYDDPEKHLYFQSDGRAAVWRDSRQGIESVKVYDLNENGKVKARGDAQKDGRQRYSSVLAVTPDDLRELREAAQKFKDEYYRGRRPYAVAVFDYLHERFENTEYDPDFLLGARR